MTRKQLILVCVAAQILIVGNPGYFNADEIETLERVSGDIDFGAIPFSWFLGDESLFFRPLGYNGFLLVQWLFGSVPQCVHLVSAVTHLLSTWLVLILCRTWTGEKGARWVAALFCLSPTSVHAVAWMAAIYDRHALLLVLLALLFCRIHLNRRLGRLAVIGAFGVVGCQALALMCKEVAIVLPALIGLDAYARRRLQGALPIIIALVVGLLVFVGWRLGVRPDVAPDSGYAIGLGVNNVLNAATFYCYPFSPELRVGWPEMGKIGPAAIGFVLSSAFVYALYRVLGWRPASMILTAAVLPLLPVLPLMKAEGQYLYATSAFLAFGLGWTVRECVRCGFLVRWMTRCLAAVFVLHGIGVQAQYWADGVMTRSTLDSLRPLVRTSTRIEPIWIHLEPDPDIRYWVVARFLNNLHVLEGRRIKVTIDGHTPSSSPSPWRLALGAGGVISGRSSKRHR
jgi:hypothetical protein